MTAIPPPNVMTATYTNSDDGIWLECTTCPRETGQVHLGWNPTVQQMVDAQAAHLAEHHAKVRHGLVFEGAPHDDAGRRIVTYARFPGVGGEGRAKCACGDLSPILPSAYQRKRWHRDIHKPSVGA